MHGFSLIELLVALGITLSVSAAAFHLFIQNERAFRDQHLRTEMHQSVRAVVAQIADEVRLAGQGVPLYSAGFDEVPQEATAPILHGSDAEHLYIRAGLSTAESSAIRMSSGTLLPGTSITVEVENTLSFSNVLGASPGRFVYLWGPAADGGWAWVRAEITSIASSSSSLILIPREAGERGHIPGSGGITFASLPAVSLEEAVSYSIVSGSIRRAVASNMSNPAAPSWGPWAELGQHFESLRFYYYTAENEEVRPPFADVNARRRISRIDIHAVAKTSEPLSNGTSGRSVMTAKSTPRNIRLAR